VSVRQAIAAAFLCGVAALAHAHAFLDHAEPRVGSTVHPPPAELKLWFTQELEPAFSTATVLDAAGKRVDKADTRVDSADPSLLRVSLESLAPGVYKVIWRAVSVDTHVTEGDFVFRVEP
jgi:methionine-rich copper-binding protein CopC